MKYSIRTKFFMTFIIILVIFGLSLLILSNLFIDKVVISANKSLISELLNENVSYFEEIDINKSVIDTLAGRNDVGIVISEDGEIINCSSLFLCSENSEELPTYISKYFPMITESESKFFTFSYKLLDVNQLVYIYNLGDNRFVVINKALDSIVQINNLIRPLIGFIIFFFLIIGFVVTRIVANKISRPIISISDYAREIAKLNFNTNILINRKDEIGQLAQNMNHISERLHFSLEELKKANELLKEDLSKEKELDKKRTRFFSTISHELKTPITIIQGYAEGLSNNIAKKPEDVKEYLEVIIEETKKMNILVNNLLDLSRYESDNFKLNKSEYDLVELIKNTVIKYQDSIRYKTINTKVLGAKNCLVFADKFRIEQVISNIISNAVKYVDQNGLINVTIIDKEKSVRINFFNSGEKIADHELNNIWNLFYKLENSKSNITGTGLGLAIVKSIIELHHGLYGVENKINGVEFFVEIPKK
ncbi:MAG: srrB [Haloplasmataceae bacterium]|nr:srrB [Haloplasmataceae bacterium]